MTAVCAHCQAPLAPDVLEGLCPRCLLRGVPVERIEDVATTPPAGCTPPAIAELAPLFPQLEILELLGQGGMGAVYKTRQIKLDRLVALKVLPSGVANDPGFAERFAREATTLARLNHPSIVGIHDFGDIGGLYYLVMEFVEGVNLRQALAGGKLQPREALAIVGELCAAMQYAHEMGVVHRDIKPENVLLDRQGRVKVADFGLAKLVSGSRPVPRLTATRQAMGTPHYMAPEQWEKPLEVDHRADVYSLGVVFYELLTGELPLGKFAPPSEKAAVDARLDAVVLRAMERQPERRYQKMSEMKTALDEMEQPRVTLWPKGASTPLENCLGAVLFVFGLAFVLLPVSLMLGLGEYWMAGLVTLGFLSIFMLLLATAAKKNVSRGAVAAGAKQPEELSDPVPSMTAEQEIQRRLLQFAPQVLSVPGLSTKEESLRLQLLYWQDELSRCLSVLPGIDPNLLATAREQCRAPADEVILAVLDFSGGKGESGLLFSGKGLHWRNGADTPHPGTGSLSYQELSGQRLVNQGDMISLDNGQFICPRPDKSGIDCKILRIVLNKMWETWDQ
jgi:serine/threonine protein kinase